MIKLRDIRELFSLSQKINAVKELIEKTFTIYSAVTKKELEIIQINQGLILSNQNLTLRKDEILEDIHKSEFKVFSQWGDDGIIDFLIKYLEIEDKRFVEFGVESYTECNTKFLLMSNNWKGLIMDGSANYMNGLRKSELYWKYNITVLDVFITKNNINNLLEENGFGGEIGILHIDIDGNDYFIWKEVSVANPIIVIVEYNSIFGFERPISTIYADNFDRTTNHHSNLLYGASLLSLCDLAEEKGYSFIGCNSNGNNAYFVRKDKLKNLKSYTAKDGYVESKFSESRNEQGLLTHLRGSDRLYSLKNEKVYNTRISEVEFI